MAFSSDGKYVVCVANDGSAWIWDLAKKTQTVVLMPLFEEKKRARELVPVVSFSPNGQHLLSAVTFAKGGFIQILDLDADPDGKMLAAGMANGSIWIWDLQNTKYHFPKEGEHGNRMDLFERFKS